MGFYVYIVRPKGSEPIEQDALEDALNQKDYLEHVRVNEWWSSGGSMIVASEDAEGRSNGPYVSCRFSWATSPQRVSDTLRTYIGLAEQLGMVVTLGEKAIRQEDVSEIAGKYFKAAETAKDLLGTVEPKRRRKLGPPLLPRDNDKYQEKLEKIRKRDFEFLNTVAYLLCMQCATTMEVTEKFVRRIEKEHGIKVESDNQFYQVEGCQLCYGSLHDNITVEELPTRKTVQ